MIQNLSCAHPIEWQIFTRLILALLDQAPNEFFLRKRGSPFRGGYFARGTDVIGDVPVPKLDLDDPQDKAFHDEAAKFMKVLRALHAKDNTISGRKMAQHTAKNPDRQDPNGCTFRQTLGP